MSRRDVEGDGQTASESINASKLDWKDRTVLVYLHAPAAGRQSRRSGHSSQGQLPNYSTGNVYIKVHA